MSESKTIGFSPEWDYLVVTASNEKQAAAYKKQIDLRRSLGLASGAKRILVVPDPGGRRIGSGGSTVHCLHHILGLERGAEHRGGGRRAGPEAWADTLDGLRILIVHAGGDSKRLPPYGPRGKIFVPVPGDSGGAAGTTIFDRLIPAYLKLPRPESGSGQVVVASGDVLLDFDPGGVMFARDGITGVGGFVAPEVAKNHGVYCRREDGSVGRFLQKPPVEKQKELGAVDARGRAVLDLGILSFAPWAAARLLDLCGPLKEIATTGLDIYLEVCCALGEGTSFAGYEEEVRAAGSRTGSAVLRRLYDGLRHFPFHVGVVPSFRFLHFGTLRDLIESGRVLFGADMEEPEKGEAVLINSRMTGAGSVSGKDSWVEGCRIEAPLKLGGDNVVVGVDVATPFALPQGGCLDIIEGTGRNGGKGWFVRLYAVGDVFHVPVNKGSGLCGLPMREWLRAMGAEPADVWDSALAPGEMTVWNGRIFPFVRARAGTRHRAQARSLTGAQRLGPDAGEYLKWLWMLDPRLADVGQKREWLAADRYSLEEIAHRADLEAFDSRRLDIRGDEIRETLPRIFSPEGELSAAEISFLARSAKGGKGGAGRAQWIVAIAKEATRAFEAEAGRKRPGLESLEIPRILHTLASVVLVVAGAGDRRDRREGRNRSYGSDIATTLEAGLTGMEKRRLREQGLPVERARDPRRWARELNDAAFRHLSRTIVSSSGAMPAPPKNMLRSDEIVWGRSPARLDLGGGWTDTPPYSLERGGCVINAAVDLNGQAPIQAYARVIEEHEIRINSIDHSTRVAVRELDELLDYRKPASKFALAKAALALTGFAPEAAAWPRGMKTLEGMLKSFGGGIELTTLAAIPSGSGLGTSSIMGAVLISIMGRVVGRRLASRELFHAVLKLEQEMTTGGGWQDQIGGAVGGVKMISVAKGLVPDPQIRFVPADVLDPAGNGGRTLLYYTGLRRLAKNILQEVVGRYLDRDRAAMETLRRLRAFPPLMAEAMGMRDEARFGELIDVAWRLNVDLDPDHTTAEIEELREKVAKHVHGAKLLGAGGGGFLLMACKSEDDAAAVRRMLEKEPPNDKARFFDFSVSREGLVTTVC